MTLQEILNGIRDLEKSFNSQEYEQYETLMGALNKHVNLERLPPQEQIRIFFERLDFEEYKVKFKNGVIIEGSVIDIAEKGVDKEEKEEKQLSIGEKLIEYATKIAPEVNQPVPKGDERKALIMIYDKFADLILNQLYCAAENFKTIHIDGGENEKDNTNNDCSMGSIQGDL